MENKTTFSKEELLSVINSNKDKAEEYFNDPTKIDELLGKVKHWLKKHKTTPVIGKFFENVVAIADLVTDYFNKNYTEIPKSSIISAIAALIYIVSPIDLIPDFIVGIGLLDDIAVVLLVLELGLGRDLNKYKEWKKARINERLERKTISIAERINNCIYNGIVAGVFILEDKTVRVLIDNEENPDKPFECYAYIFKFDEEDFLDEDIVSSEDKFNFIVRVFNNEIIRWNEACVGRIMYEHKCVDFDEFYYTIDREDY